MDNQKNVRKGRVSEVEFFFIFLDIGVLGAVIGILISPFIVLLSPGFDASVFVLQILCLSLPLFFLTSDIQWLLIARDWEKGLRKIYLFGAFFHMLLDVYVVPRYLYVVVVIITGVCEGIVLLLLLYALHSTKNLRKVDSKRPL